MTPQLPFPPRAAHRPSFVVRMRLLGLGLCLVLVAACHHRRGGHAPSSDPAAVAAQLREHLADAPDDDDARRQLALIEWIHLGQTKTAMKRFDRLAKASDPTARLAKVIVADAKLDYATVERETFELVEALGRDPKDDGGLTAVAAEFAVRRLRDHHGRLRGDDDRFVAFFDGLDLTHLPVGVRQPLVSERASIARRRGEDYAKYYAAEGCVQTWTVGAIEGRHGAMDLAAVEPGPLTADPDAVLAQLACVVRVWNPAAAPGVRRMQSYLRTDAKVLSLELGAQYASRFWLDGQLIHRTDRLDRFPADRVRYDIPVAAGVHVLEVATTIDSERAWVLVRATDAAGEAVPLESAAPAKAAGLRGKARDGGRPDWKPQATPLGNLYAAPLVTLLSIEDAIADGDPDRGELADAAGRRARYADQAPFAEGDLWRSRLWRLDASRGATASQTRERAALRAALRSNPTIDAARLRLLRMRLSRGEDQEVADALAHLPAARLRSVEGELLRERVHRSRSDEHAADEALARAAKLNPDDCRVLIAQRARAQVLDDVQTEDDVSTRLAPCAGSDKLRARLAERRGQLPVAQSLWTEQLDRVPDELEALESLARLAALTGDHEAAQRHLETILRLNPFRVASHVAMADLAASRGDVESARGHIRRAIARIPYATALWEAADTLGLPDELPQWRVDGRAALRDYQASGETYEGVQEVLVLDRSAVRVYPDGGQRQLVHLLVHLLSKEAIDRYGEMNPPDGGRLLTLHTIKPDGTTLEPEVVAGKDGVSLRDLKIGDFVEYEFVLDQPASPQLPGYVDVSTFRFQSFDVPYHRSELMVIAPPDLPLRSDRRNDPPAEIKRDVVVGGTTLTTRLWRADRVPRLGVEPGHRDLLEEVPSVHVYTPLPLTDWLRSMAAQIRDVQRSNPQLRAHVRRLVGKRKDARAKLDVLWKWVVDHVEPASDLTTPATETFALKRGNRLMLLRAMLEIADIPSELWLVKDSYGPAPLPGGHPLVEMYDAPMLAVTLEPGQPPLLVNTASEVIPMAYLAPGYRHAPALRVPLSGETGAPQVTMPDGPVHLADGRTWSLAVDLDARGNATIEGTLTLTGMEAVRWRQALDQIDRDRISDVFLEAELGWVRGGNLGDLTIEGEHALEEPLRLHFVATGSGLGVEQGGARILQAVPMPLSVAPAYASLPKRTTGLLMPYAPDQRATIEYRLEGAKFADVPAPQDVRSQWGTYARTTSGGGAGQGTLVLEIESTLRTGVVEPAQYGGLAEFAREVEAAQQAVVRVR